MRSSGQGCYCFRLFMGDSPSDQGETTSCSIFGVLPTRCSVFFCHLPNQLRSHRRGQTTGAFFFFFFFHAPPSFCGSCPDIFVARRVWAVPSLVNVLSRSEVTQELFGYVFFGFTDKVTAKSQNNHFSHQPQRAIARCDASNH